MTRYLGEDEGDHLVGLYVRPRDVPGAIDRIEAALREQDPAAMLTGYTRLESSLRASLSHDIPRIAIVAGVLVFLALAPRSAARATCSSRRSSSRRRWRRCCSSFASSASRCTRTARS
jgi:hypothetical protein